MLTSLGNFSSRYLQLVMVTNVTMPRDLAFVAVLLVYAFGLIKCDEVNIQCVPLRACPELLNLLKEYPASQKVVKLLKSSHCGFEADHPKVWCTDILSNCKTPDGRSGKCVPVKKCEPFLRIIKIAQQITSNAKDYLQKFRCQDPNSSTGGLSVCCPANQEPILPVPLSAIDTPTVTPTRPSFLPRPTQGECGRQSSNKIIGGKVTEMDEFPWTALLEYSQDWGSGTITACGGSLISSQYVITAAHCVDTTAVRRIGELTNVILGEFDTRNETDCINGLGIENCADPPVRVQIQETLIHPLWYAKSPSHLNHDIALLRLAQSVTFTDYIQPICLPSPTLTLKEKQRLVVTGWGQTEEGSASFVKLKTSVPVVNKASCIQKYKNDKHLTVGDGELCAGGEEGKDSCSGDSGGPLMLSVDRIGNSFWFLVGIVSFGPNQPCGLKDYPALYTYIPKYIDWIYETIQP